MITASSLSRLMHCPDSVTLPRAENASQWADAGHDEHEDLARQLAAGMLPDWIALAIPPGSRSELAVAFCVATGVGRIIGENLGRSYGSMGPFEICGSADVVGVEGDAVVVIDFKTGFLDVESAATNPQLAFYALAAARAFGKYRAIVRIVYTKSERIDESEMDAIDLASFAGQLKSLHVRIAASQAAKTAGTVASTREGSWCRHCPGRAHCPSKNALLVQVAEGGLAIVGDTAMTSDRAVAAYEQINRIEQLVKDARKRLETYVEESGPIDLGDGRMFGRYHRKGNEKLDGSVAIDAIRQVVGESAKEFESIAIGHVTSKAAIDRAAKQLIPAGAAKVAKAVIARVRELGGISSSPSYPIGEYRAGKDQPAPREPLDVDSVNKLLEAAG